MRFKNKIIKIFCAIILSFPLTGNAQKVVRDNEKKKQWQSMENGPWDFAPDWYYFFLHKRYSGAEMYWDAIGRIVCRLLLLFDSFEGKDNVSCYFQRRMKQKTSDKALSQVWKKPETMFPACLTTVSYRIPSFLLPPSRKPVQKPCIL